MEMNLITSSVSADFLTPPGVPPWRDSHSACARADCPTFLYNRPALPGGRIDHIFYRGDGLTPQAWARLNSPDPNRRLSDHDPVCVRFRLDVTE